MTLLVMTSRLAAMVATLYCALGPVAGLRAEVQLHTETSTRTGSGFDCYITEREGHYHFGITLKVVVAKKHQCNFFVISSNYWTKQVVNNYFTAEEEGKSCKCVHDGETLCRFVPKKFADAPACDAKSCFTSFSYLLHVAARHHKKESEYYSMIHEFSHFEVDPEFSGTETAPTVMETVKALAAGNKEAEAKILRELAGNGATVEEEAEGKILLELAKNGATVEEAGTGSSDSMGEEGWRKKENVKTWKEAQAENSGNMVPEESVSNKPHTPLVKVMVMNGQETEVGEIPDPVRVEEGGGTTPVVVPLELLAVKMSKILINSEDGSVFSQDAVADLTEEDKELIQNYLAVSQEDLNDMQLPVTEKQWQVKKGPKPLRGVLTLKSGGVTCADVKPPSPELVCGEITYAEECVAATVMLEEQWTGSGAFNKLGRKPFEDLTKGGSQASFAPHCSARVEAGDRWHVKFNGPSGEKVGAPGPDDKLICGCWAGTGKMSKPLDCDASLKGVQCAGAPITWPTFMHLYAQTVMNEAAAKELGISFGREMVSEAWNDYKMRCPEGLRAPGVVQPCHSLPPSNIAGIRIGYGNVCVVAFKEGGHVSTASVEEEGKVLGTKCTKFSVLPVSELSGRLQDKATGLCLGLHSTDDRTLVTAKCGKGYDMWTHVADREDYPLCLSDPENPEQYRTSDGKEYCLGFA